MGNLKSLDDEIRATHAKDWTQQKYDKYVTSLTPEERHTHFQRIIGMGWAMGDTDFAIRVQLGYNRMYGHERRKH